MADHPTEIVPVGGVQWCVVHHGIGDELASHGPDGSWCDLRQDHELEFIDCDSRPMFHWYTATEMSADQLAAARVVWAARVVELSDWQRRAVNVMRELHDEIDPDDTDPLWAALLDLCDEEWGDDDEEADRG